MSNEKINKWSYNTMRVAIPLLCLVAVCIEDFPTHWGFVPFILVLIFIFAFSSSAFIQSNEAIRNHCERLSTLHISQWPKMPLDTFVKAVEHCRGKGTTFYAHEAVNYLFDVCGMTMLSGGSGYYTINGKEIEFEEAPRQKYRTSGNCYKVRKLDSNDTVHNLNFIIEKPPLELLDGEFETLNYYGRQIYFINAINYSLDTSIVG